MLTPLADRVRDIEYDTLTNSGRNRQQTLEWERDTTRTEIIIEGDHSRGGRRHRNRYYY